MLLSDPGKTGIAATHIRIGKDKIIIADCLKVIEDFKPDIIHVFGSEWGFGLVEKYVDIPVVIHMQGSLPPYVNASYPPGYNFFTQWKTIALQPYRTVKKTICME